MGHAVDGWHDFAGDDDYFVFETGEVGTLWIELDGAIDSRIQLLGIECGGVPTTSVVVGKDDQYVVRVQRAGRWVLRVRGQQSGVGYQLRTSFSVEPEAYDLVVRQVSDGSNSLADQVPSAWTRSDDDGDEVEIIVQHGDGDDLLYRSDDDADDVEIIVQDGTDRGRLIRSDDDADDVEIIVQDGSDRGRFIRSDDDADDVEIIVQDGTDRGRLIRSDDDADDVEIIVQDGTGHGYVRSDDDADDVEIIVQDLGSLMVIEGRDPDVTAGDRLAALSMGESTSIGVEGDLTLGDDDYLPLEIHEPGILSILGDMGLAASLFWIESGRARQIASETRLGHADLAMAVQPGRYMVRVSSMDSGSGAYELGIQMQTKE
ncbi:MAG: hypothetical protein AAGD38_04705 [Acidobacteriota bacterium]